MAICDLDESKKIVVLFVYVNFKLEEDNEGSDIVRNNSRRSIWLSMSDWRAIAKSQKGDGAQRKVFAEF